MTTPDAREPRPHSAEECDEIADKAIRCINYPTGTRDIAQLYDTLAQLRRDVDALATRPAPDAAAGVPRVEPKCGCVDCDRPRDPGFAYCVPCKNALGFGPCAACKRDAPAPEPDGPRVGDVWQCGDRSPSLLLRQDEEGFWVDCDLVYGDEGTQVYLHTAEGRAQYRWRLIYRPRTPAAEPAPPAPELGEAELKRLAREERARKLTRAYVCDECGAQCHDYAYATAEGSRRLCIACVNNVVIERTADRDEAERERDRDMQLHLDTTVERDTAQRDLAAARAELAQAKADLREYAADSIKRHDGELSDTMEEYDEEIAELRSDLAAARGERDARRSHAALLLAADAVQERKHAIAGLSISTHEDDDAGRVHWATLGGQLQHVEDELRAEAARKISAPPAVEGATPVHRSQLIHKGLYGGNTDPNRCVCAEKETGKYAGTPHTHYAEPPHACARGCGCGCKAYEPAEPEPAPVEVPT